MMQTPPPAKRRRRKLAFFLIFGAAGALPSYGIWNVPADSLLELG
jgi:hypothetical protein